MKIIKYIIVFYTALSAVVMAQENQVLYCTDTNSNGFIANEKGDGYKRSAFKLSRYTVSIGDLLGGAYDMTMKSPSGSIYFQCRNIFTVTRNAIACNDTTDNFILNLDTLNYTFSRGFGWVLGVEDTLFISYGTCAKF